jgi:choline dehydrogenase-like flavoprotein
VIIDLLHEAVPEALEADLCVIGGGPAGLAIAHALIESGLSVLLVESGGLKAEERAQALCEGESAGPMPFDLAHSRMRVLGGSCNLWGGGCIPLSDDDMRPRPWVPDSGWPLRYDDLAPWYQRAHAFCRIDPAHGFHAGEFDGPAPRTPLPLDPSALSNMTFARSPILFGDAYHAELKAAGNVRVLLHANVVALHATPDARGVTAATLGTLDGRRMGVKARHFVLACGGIENARLLLASNDVAPRGLGNDRDVVGRYFMDHPRGVLGEVHADAPDALIRPYERTLGRIRASLANEIGVAPEAQCRLGMLNARVHPFAVEAPLPQGVRALRDIRTALRPPPRMESVRVEARLSDAMQNGPRQTPVAQRPLARNVLSLGIHMLDVVQAVARKAGDRPTVRSAHASLVGFFEQAPCRDSRITLSESRDALGMPRARVHWRLTDLDRHTYTCMARLAGPLLAQACGGTFVPSPWIDAEGPPDVFGTAHHMGATRMSADPAKGVVDAHGTVHGMHNLHVAGSSVFPTGGWAFPTFTIVALSLRLADHLRVLMSSGV